jgi:hypothetical protein
VGRNDISRSRNWAPARIEPLLTLWPESENNGTPGPDLFSVSRSYFLTQEEPTDNVSVGSSLDIYRRNLSGDAFSSPVTM